MELGELIKTQRVRMGKTLEEVGKEVGVSKTTVQRWESGEIKDMRRDKLVKLAHALDTTPAYLMGWENNHGETDVVLAVKSIANKKRISYEEAEQQFNILTNPDIQPLPRTVKKPRLGKIACGEPILAVENLDGYDDVPENIRCDFTLICQGDSMIGARIHDGDVVYIRQQPEVENGEIAAVLLDGSETTLRRFYISGGIITLQAENPSFAPIVVTGERQCAVLGKAVGFTSLIK